MSVARRPWLGLLAALCLYFALRGLILYTAFDRVAMAQYELFPMGTIPVVLGTDGGLPVVRMYDNAAGQLVDGLLAWPLYRVLGPSWLALKLVPLLLGAATLVLLWSLLRAPFGERAALLAALLFAVGPTTMTTYSMMASGNHFENLCFTTLALWSALRMHALGVTRARLVGSGAAAGFALFVFLGALTPIALLALVHLGLRGARATLRDLAWLLPGFAAGLAPLVAINAATGWRGFTFLDQRFGGAQSGFDLARCGGRLWEFFVSHLPVASQYPSVFGVAGSALDLVFLAVFVLAYVALSPSAGRGARALLAGARGAGTPGALGDMFVLALVAYLPLTAVAYALGDFTIAPYQPPVVCGGYRYFNPHFLFACALLAIAAVRMPWRRVGATLAGVAIAVGAANFALVDWSFATPGLGAHYEGANIRQLANQFVSPRNGYTPAEISGLVERYPRAFRPWLDLALGRAAAAKRIPRPGASADDVRAQIAALDLAALLAAFPPERRSDAARGVGVLLRHLWRMRTDMRNDVLAQLARWSAAGEPFAELAIEGLATDWEFHLHRDTARTFAELDELLRSLPPELRASFARGYGAECGRLLHRGIAADEAPISHAARSMPAELARSFYAGVGIGLVDPPFTLGRASAVSAVLPPDADFDALEAASAQRRAELGK